MATPMFASSNAKRNVPCPAFLLIPVAILLAGCATNQQQAKEDKAAAEEAAKQIGTIDDARCQSYGSGSPDYAQCRTDIDRGHKQMGIKE